MEHLRTSLAAAAMLAAMALAAPGPARAEDRGAMALALAAADARNWTVAQEAARRSGPVARALVAWQALRAGRGDASDYVAFLRDHGDWPGLDLLRQQGDARMRPDLPAAELRDWFADRVPDTPAAETAYLATLDPFAARVERARFWSATPLDPAAESAFLSAHGPELAPLMTGRATAMLDRAEPEQARRLLARLPGADRALIDARIALQTGRAGVDDLILALPAAAQVDPGLTMDRFLWRVRAKQHEGAQALMLAASTDAAGLRDPARWASMRVDYARMAMRAGDWTRALALARPHFLQPDNRHYADLEWLAGFAALQSGDADGALAHFRHLETVVGSQISRARAFYWQGRALEALDDPAARGAYARAAAMPATYYGQLGAERIGAAMPPDLAAPGPLPDWRGSALVENPVFRAGLWLLATGRRDEAQRFFLHLGETTDPQDTLRMARLMAEAGATWHALRLSKRAADKGVIHPGAHFPLTGLQDTDFGIPPELVLAIARQESEFNPAAQSPVGARGLMQVMPDTARQMARQIREPFDVARLTGDGAYNARLGAAYLEGLRNRFGGSSALVASGYNAGPGRPARWLDQFGDLRRDADPVTWVELIPFDETRNYVMRVTEALPVYRARLLGRPVPIVPSWDLTGGGLMPPPVARLTLALSARPPARPFIGPSPPLDRQPPAVEASGAAQTAAN